VKKTLMMDEIVDQPAVLERTAAAVNDYLRTQGVEKAPEGRILLTGCGDMDFSARACAGLASTASPSDRWRISAASSMEMRWEADHLGAGDTVIVSSFSGLTPRSVEALLLARARGARVISITGNRSSTLAREADDVLFLPTGPGTELNKHAYAGYHANVPQTKTYMAALFAELLLLEHLLSGRNTGSGRWRAELEALPSHLGEVMTALEPTIDQWVSTSLGTPESIAILGSGIWRPAATYGAAKFLEMSIASRHQCLEEFNHLELFLTGSESLVVFVCPDSPSWTRGRELVGPYERLGCGRLVLGAASALSGNDHSLPAGVGSVPLAGDGCTSLFFSAIAALQFLAAAIGPALGRDIDRWVGGVRTGLIEDLSQVTIRASHIRAPGSGETD